MKLSTLLSEISCNVISGNPETEITSVAYDSRKVKPGSLFVCIKGFQVDGHAYIPKALEAGAAAILVEDVPSEPIDAAVVKVENARTALAYLSATWFGHPARKMTMIVLTGTKGKTTTTHMIKKILEASGSKVGMIGTIGAFIGHEKVPVKNTTPESYELHALFDQMHRAGCTYVVMEVSSQALKLDRTVGIEFDYGAFLNLSPDHIGPDEHADFEEYKACKTMMFSQVKESIVNIDGDYWEEVTAPAKQVVTVSRSQDADYMGRNAENVWEPSFLGVHFDLSGKLEGKIQMNMPGEFNVENALVAIAITNRAGISYEAICQGLKTVSVKGRTQLLTDASHISTFIIDYAHNAISTENLLKMLKGYNPNKLVCLFGGGGNRTVQRRYDMGMISGKYADLTIVTMDNPRDEDMNEINKMIIQGLDAHHGAYKVIDDRKEAIHYLLDTCGPGDIAVMIGKGHEEYQEIHGVKHPFSEERIVSEYAAVKKREESKQ